MEIRNLNIKDSIRIAEIHIKAFHGFFLTSLGYEFLIEFYKSIFHNSNNISLGLLENGKLIAFVVGVKKNKSFYKKLFVENLFTLLPLISKKIIIKPTLFFQLMISYFSTKKIKLDKTFESCLLSICIDPEFANKGFGTHLIHEFELCLKKNGISKYYLTTDSVNNDSTNFFYIKNNFKLSSSYLQGQRLMNIYTKEIK